MSFASDLTTFAKKAERNIETVKQTAARDLVNDVIDDTPQDSGYAAANWQSGDASGPVDRTSVAAAKAEALGAIARWQGGDRPLVFANAAPYIFALEFGDSKHDPAGMVFKNVKRWPSYVRTAARSVHR